MTNLTLTIIFFAIFNVSLCNNCRAVDEILMLPAPEDVYQKEKHVEFSEVIVPLSVFMVAPVSKVYTNITIPSRLEAPKPVVSGVFVEASEDDIHEKSMKIAAFVAQCIIFLFVYTIVTMDVEQFEVTENEDIPVYRLHKAREVETCPMPAFRNAQMVRRRIVDTDRQNVQMAIRGVFEQQRRTDQMIRSFCRGSDC